MIVGFWNTFRKTSMRSNGLYTLDFIKQWMAETPLDILVLAEVTQDYQPIVARMQALWRTHRIDYVPCADSADGVSPCSFIYMVSNPLFSEVTPTGSDTRRPILMIPTANLIVGAVHIAADRDEAPEEILTACDEINHEDRPSLLIGDMNYPFSSAFPSSEEEYLGDLEFERVPPGMQATFKSGEILDYAFRSANVANIDPVPFAPGYCDWENVDHAPIAYEVP